MLESETRKYGMGNYLSEIYYKLQSEKFPNTTKKTLIPGDRSRMMTMQ